MDKIRKIFLGNTKSVTLYASVFGGIFLLLIWRLGSLTNELSAEQSIAADSGTIKNILQDPTGGPYKLLLWTVKSLGLHDVVWTRLISVIIAIAVLGMFCWQLRVWHGKIAAVVGTILFGTSAWFLHVGRLGASEILAFGAFALVASAVWAFSTGKKLALLVCLVLAATQIYVPGMIWFVGAGIIWQWKTLDQIFRKNLWFAAISGIVFVLTLGPLLWTGLGEKSSLRHLLGLPNNLLSGETWSKILQNLTDLPSQLFIHGPSNSPDLWFYGAAILDIFAVAMLIFGIYAYIQRIGRGRVRLFGSVLLLWVVFTAIGQSVTLTTVIPFVYFLVAVGFGFFADQWFKVFPRNPIARGTGIFLLAIMLLTSVNYNLRHYFVAWPNSTQISATISKDTKE